MAESNQKSKVNDEIKKLAGSSSKGKCAAIVREAVQKARNEKVQPTGIESAKDYGSWLTQRNYSSSSKKCDDAVKGDICIFKGTEKHPHGHIQVYCDDGKWRSDFVQKGFYPYADGTKPDYTIYE